MTQSDQRETKLPENYQAGAIIGRRRPDEVAFPLRQDEFLILCDGASGKDRAARDLYLGFFVGALIGLVGLAANIDWPTLFAQRKWFVFSCFLVLVVIAVASITGCISHWGRMTQEDTPESRLKKKIHDFFPTVDSSFEIPNRELPPGPHGIEVGEIPFEYVPAASPLHKGWTLAGPSATPSFSRSAPPNGGGGLTMETESKNAVDYKLEKYQRASNRLRFMAKMSDDAHVYARIQLVSTGTLTASKTGWIACDIGDRPPKKLVGDEWVICRKPRQQGWALFDLSLPDEVGRTFGSDEGLKFAELLAIRLRGTLSISTIKLFRDDAVQDTT